MKDDENTRKIPQTPPGGLARDAEATNPIGDRGARPPRFVDEATDERTLLYRPGRADPAPDPPVGSAPMRTGGCPEDPVVGWLVIVDGPGRGASFCLGYGFNPVGRSADQRIRLDFGDSELSRRNHASVTYDPRGRRYYLQHGGGSNLTYLGEAPVLQPVELQGGETIMLGRTTLKFVPFCGKDFEWTDA